MSLGRLVSGQLAHGNLLGAREDGRPRFNRRAVDVERTIGAGGARDTAVVCDHRAGGRGIAETEELGARVSEGARPGNEIIEHLDQRPLLDAAEEVRGGARQEEAVVDGGVGEPGTVHIGPVFGSTIASDIIDRRVERRETITNHEQGVLVADVHVGVRVLGERDGWPEGDFSVDRGIYARGTDRRAAEGKGGVLAWFEDFGPIIGPAYDEFEAVRGRGIARWHGARSDARGLWSGHGRGRVGVDKNREAERIAAPADAVVEDGEDLWGLARAREGRARRNDLGGGDAAAINAIRVLPHRV